jgi:hypothetical protein
MRREPSLKKVILISCAIRNSACQKIDIINNVILTMILCHGSGGMYKHIVVQVGKGFQTFIKI